MRRCSKPSNGSRASTPLQLPICNEDHRFIVAEQMRHIGVEPNAILEPMGRNTAPVATVAALQVTASGDDPLLLVLAADHLIRDSAQFRQAIEAGRKPAGRAPGDLRDRAKPGNRLRLHRGQRTAFLGEPPMSDQALCRSSTRPPPNSSWPPAASPGTAACSTRASAMPELERLAPRW